jgi:uncharacterized membrane protein
LNQPEISCSGSSSEHWMLKRNCSMSPTQSALMFGGLMLLSFLVAGFWAYAGAWWVLVFSAVEVVALAVAFIVYARHASDYESLVLDGDHVRIELVDGAKIHRLEGSRRSIALCVNARKRGLVEVREVTAGGRSLSIGRFLPEEQRAQLAQALAQRLRVPLERSS